MDPTVGQIASKYTPRWIKCIRWNDALRRMKHMNHQLWCFAAFPLICEIYFCQTNLINYSWMLYFKRPNNEEDRLDIKRDAYTENEHQVNWAPGQYLGMEKPPLFDLAERRKKYSEYYGDRYDGFIKVGKLVLQHEYRDPFKRNSMWK